MAEIGFCTFIIATRGNSTKPKRTKYQVNVNRFYFRSEVRVWLHVVHLSVWAVSVELFLFSFSFVCFVSSVQFRLKFITSFLFSSVLIVLEMVTNEPNKHACKQAGRDFGVHVVALLVLMAFLLVTSHRIFQFSRFTRLVCVALSLFVYVCVCEPVSHDNGNNVSRCSEP